MVELFHIPPITPVAKDFNPRLTLFVQQLRKLVQNQNITTSYGSKFIKVIIGPFNNEKAHLFVDFAGNIYKAETWKFARKPHISSIFDANCGISDLVAEQLLPENGKPNE